MCVCHMFIEVLTYLFTYNTLAVGSGTTTARPTVCKSATANLRLQPNMSISYFAKKTLDDWIADNDRKWT